MQLISELGGYFSVDEILFLKDKLDKYEIPEEQSFQQISQAENKIKFDFGFVLNDSIIDITYSNKILEKNIVKIKNIQSIQIQETANSFRINIFVPENKYMYYTASSNTKIQKLKKFASFLEELYTGGKK